MLNLDDPIVRAKFVLDLQKQVNDFCVKEFDEEERKHLGASLIGHDCQAYLWNTFRWLLKEQFDGRMLRLFNRGHTEEPRFIRWLSGAGIIVHDVDENTKNQFRIKGCNGHFGGSLDSFGFREDIGYILLEFKTHSEKSFTDLKKKKLLLSKPKHYKQMCSYGQVYQLHFGLYCAVNKNNDEIHFELVKLDWNEADDLFRKADGIVNRQTMPNKIAQVATYHECKYCPFAGICHRGDPPAKNCRSCRSAKPVEDGQWYCDTYKQIIPEDYIKQGCENWTSIV